MIFSDLNRLPGDENNRPASGPMFNIAQWHKRFDDTDFTGQEY
jgi:hypothetical protein